MGNVIRMCFYLFATCMVACGAMEAPHTAEATAGLSSCVEPPLFANVATDQAFGAGSVIVFRQEFAPVCGEEWEINGLSFGVPTDLGQYLGNAEVRIDGIMVQTIPPPPQTPGSMAFNFSFPPTPLKPAQVTTIETWFFAGPNTPAITIPQKNHSEIWPDDASPYLRRTDRRAVQPLQRGGVQHVSW